MGEPATTQESAEDLRKRGNELYKSSKFTEAIELYEQAAKLAPSEAAPLSNLSAAHFELGVYQASEDTCTRALVLLGNDAGASIEKLRKRRAKSRVHLNDFAGAKEDVQYLKFTGDRAALEDCIRSQEGSRSLVAAALQASDRQDALEYYVVGHDNPEPLYGPELLETGRDTISLMFGGIGDARHLHVSLIVMFNDFVGGKVTNKRFHFTMVDIKASVLARDLLIFLMLGELGRIMNVGSEGADLQIACLYYTYLAPTMPGPVGKALQAHIQTLIDMLEDRKALPAYLDMPRMYRPDVLKVLREWQHDAAAAFSAKYMRARTVQQRQTDLMKWEMGLMPGLSDVRPEKHEQWKAEQDFYEKTGIMAAPKILEHLHEHNIRIGYKKFRNSPSMPTDSLTDTVDAQWAPNVTFDPLNGYPMDLAHNPFGFGESLLSLGIPITPPTGADPTAYHADAVNGWFTMRAVSIDSLKDQLKIEACLGDVTAVLEQIRHGIVGHRKQDDRDTVDPTSQAYPQMYDRIHLSNIPDYIGCSLASFLYATPVVHPGETSYVTSTCLRNPPRFPTVASYHNEYTAPHSASDLTKGFGVYMTPPPKDEYNEYLMSRKEPMPMNQYHYWHHSPSTGKLADLMPRDKLETWLYRLYVKICIPVHKDAIEFFTLIYAPQNQTAFLRVISHLYDIGYPAHWLSNVIGELLGGIFKTGARPPRTEPLKLRETKADMPVIQQCTTPFAGEFSTLVSIWQFALPFGITAPQIPPIDMIRQYTVKFKQVQDITGNVQASC